MSMNRTCGRCARQVEVIDTTMPPLWITLTVPAGEGVRPWRSQERPTIDLCPFCARDLRDFAAERIKRDRWGNVLTSPEAAA